MVTNITSMIELPYRLEAVLKDHGGSAHGYIYDLSQPVSAVEKL